MSKRYTLTEVIGLYVDGYGNAQTRKTKRRDLRQFAELVGPGWYLDEIDWLQVRRYQGRIASNDVNNGNPYAPNTRRTKLKTVRVFFNWCKKRGLIDENPTDDLDIPPERLNRTREKAFSNEDVQKLLDYAEGRTILSGRRLRDLALLLFCHDTGVRRGGLAQMVRSDVNLETRRAVIVNTKTKGGPRRYIVSFSPYTARVLGEWFEVLPDAPDAHLWNALQPGKPMSRDAISQVIGRMCDKVGIKRRSVHALRRHVGFRMADNGANAGDIANVLDNSPDVAAKYYMPHDTETAWKKAAKHHLPDPQENQKKPGKTVRFDDSKTG